MFEPNSDMEATKFEHKSVISAPRTTGVAVLTWLLICVVANAFANPASEYESAALTTEVSQAFPPVPTHAESAGAMFMIGLVVGMVSGITLFFVHLRRREKRLARFSLDDMMLDNWPPATDASSWSSPASTTSPWDSEPGDEMIEKSDPWERSVDWWKNPDDQ